MPTLKQVSTKWAICYEGFFFAIELLECRWLVALWHPQVINSLRIRFCINVEGLNETFSLAFDSLLDEFIKLARSNHLVDFGQLRWPNFHIILEDLGVGFDLKWLAFFLVNVIIFSIIKAICSSFSFMLAAKRPHFLQGWQLVFPRM